VSESRKRSAVSVLAVALLIALASGFVALFYAEGGVRVVLRFVFVLIVPTTVIAVFYWLHKRRQRDRH